MTDQKPQMTHVHLHLKDEFVHSGGSDGATELDNLLPNVDQ